ncbi:MAG: XdhC/CoxI family protein [Eubacteriales bacterium]
MNIIEEQLKAQKNNKAYAMATIIETHGATPRSVGSKMMVFENGTIAGTVGGGVLEEQVKNDAIEILKKNKKVIKTYENKAQSDISPCGGNISVFIESYRSNTNLVVCGAGHVGAAVIKMASLINYHITVLDTRDTDITKENVKDADCFELIPDFYQGIKDAEIAEGSYVLVSTYGHEEDCEALAAVLEKKAAYIGMMGSPIKIKSIFNKLLERGFTQEQLDFIHTPVGLNIGGETPAEIAVSILSEIQAVRYNKENK